MAELGADEKNRISHRARAMAKMAQALAGRYGKI
jgi:inosine/xanthosine triphosphate pyrophosphatase family protein